MVVSAQKDDWLQRPTLLLLLLVEEEDDTIVYG